MSRRPKSPPATSRSIASRQSACSASVDWPAKLDFHTGADGEPYWWEAACYEFSAAEIDRVEASDGTAPPKMLEYNADTPTALIEAAVVQSYWLEEVKPGYDQFNSIHEKLIERWRNLRARVSNAARLHLTGVFAEPEDRYIQDVAGQAGWSCVPLDIADIGWNGRTFTDLSEAPIRFLFKLYPWEWLLREAFGPDLLTDAIGMVEPPWKMVLSNKAILPILGEMFPGHPNLLPAAREREAIAGACVEKPIHGREGSDIRRVGDRETVVSRPDRIYQAAVPLPQFDGGTH
jgi:glutathionylspermidine synthase